MLSIQTKRLKVIFIYLYLYPKLVNSSEKVFSLKVFSSLVLLKIVHWKNCKIQNCSKKVFTTFSSDITSPKIGVPPFVTSCHLLVVCRPSLSGMTSSMDGPLEHKTYYTMTSTCHMLDALNPAHPIPDSVHHRKKTSVVKTKIQKWTTFTNKYKRNGTRAWDEKRPCVLLHRAD